MKEDKVQKTDIKKIIKIVFIILYQILVIIALMLTMVIVLQKVSNSNKTIFGYRIFRVITGSMEPEYEVGEVVISKQVDPNDIKVGDDIVYLGKNGEYAGKIIMHNVIDIEKNEKGKLIFHAKGLSPNSVEDPTIKEDQIYGVVKYKANILTILYNCATNIYAVFFIIIVLVLNVFISFNTPKKVKKHKIKQIASTSNELENDFEEQEVEYKEEKIKKEINEKIEKDEINEEDEEDEQNETNILDKTQVRSKKENLEERKNEKKHKSKNHKINTEKKNIDKEINLEIEKKKAKRKKEIPSEKRNKKEQ